MVVKVVYLISGLFLFLGMTIGILKYRAMMRSEDHKAPVYIDIAHRSALLYSFAAMVMAQLLQFSPYSLVMQAVIVGVPLMFFFISTSQYLRLGLKGQEITQYAEKNFNTTWGTYVLIVGQLGGVGLIVWGYVETQLLS